LTGLILNGKKGQLRMRLKRRDFIRIGGAGLFLAGLDPLNILAASPPPLNPASPFYEQLASEEFPFPYDDAVFDAAERIANVRRNPSDTKTWLTDLNLLVKSGKRLDIKVYVADRRENLANPMDLQSFTGVQGSLDTQLRGYDSARLYYQVQYREGQGAWKSLFPRSLKLPNTSLQDGGQFQAIFLGDDHSFDDADFVVSPADIQSKITGDFFYQFHQELKANPSWEPSDPWNQFVFSFALAKAQRHILSSEDPDFFVNLGDSNGIGAGYKWESWGLPYKNLSDQDYEYIAKTLWYRSRKIFSAITPNIPVYWALGNHDGDENWNAARFRSKYWRQKVFALPGQTTYSEGGHPDGNYYAFSWGADKDNRGGAQFIILDVTGFTGNEPVKAQDWTLGAEQRQWFENVLSKNDHDWSFACFHHALGGWPKGSNENDSSIAYGRGPLFTEQDYSNIADPALVEQVALTNLGKQYGLRGFIYGHDHIFKVMRIGESSNKKDLLGVCVGSTKSIGEEEWWKGTYWKRFYGDGFKSNPDFFGPSGITRMTINSDKVKIDYICTRRTSPASTNLPGGGSENAIYASSVTVNPQPSIDVDKTSITFETTERSSLPPPNQILKVRNGGGQVLRYSVNASQDWIAVNPNAGNSWASWTDVTVSITAGNSIAGTYNGTIKVESSTASNGSIQIPVQYVVKEAPLYMPLNFAGTRMGGAYSTSRQDAIILTWQANGLNANVTKYRLYVYNDLGARTKIGEAAPSTRRFEFYPADKNKSYKFDVAAVNDHGREGESAATTVAKSF
jgi:hypothetical protein